MKLPRLSAVLLAILAVFALGACGETSSELEAESEAQYVELGGLRYQVQLSRILNPADSEDRDYLAGLSEEDQQLPPDTDYFAVWLRVQNEESEALPTAERFEIEDTQGRKFQPLPNESALAYKPAELAGDSLLPDPNSVASEGPAQGLVLVFQIPPASLDNRPLEFEITNPTDFSERAKVRLDV